MSYLWAALTWQDYWRGALIGGALGFGIGILPGVSRTLFGFLFMIANALFGKTQRRDDDPPDF